MSPKSPPWEMGCLVCDDGQNLMLRRLEPEEDVANDPCTHPEDEFVGNTQQR